MAKNEILPFAIADGANVLPADEYQKLTARNNGFSAGVARSQELNKVWRQSALIAHVVAQFIAETNNSDVLDDGNVDKLKAGLISALSKNVNNTVPAATKTVAGVTKLSSATNSDDETQAATPKAVKIAYDLAKTVSIDEINKKLDKASVLQTTGNATDKVMSQKACDELFAKKDSWEKFIVGQIDIRSNGNYTSLTLIKGDGQKLGFETAPGDAYFVYRDAKNNNKAVVTIPSKKDGTLALTSDVDTRGAKNTANGEGNGWWKCGDTGMIFQWGFDGIGGSATEKTVTFPFAFKTECFNVQITPSYVNGSPDAAILLKAISRTSFTSYRVSDTSYNFYWYAIGK